MDNTEPSEIAIPSGKDSVVTFLTEGTASQGIEHSPQAEVEGELTSYFADLEEAIQTEKTDEAVDKIRTSIGVCLAGERVATVRHLTVGTASEGIEYSNIVTGT